MNNPYLPPTARVDDFQTGGFNNSGGGSLIDVPPEVKGWSWGAFLLNWIWGGFNKTYIGFLALIPYVGFIAAIYLGFKGRELAWRNKKWDSIDHFNKVQKKWSQWGVGIIIVPMIIGILAAIILPMTQK